MRKSAPPCLRQGYGDGINATPASFDADASKLVIYECAKAHVPACDRDWKGGRSPLRSNGATSGTLESPSAAHIHKNEKNIF